MSEYKLDGKYLVQRGSRIGEIDGKYVKDSHGSRVGEIDGKYIKDAHGSRIAELDGQNVKDSHGSRIGTIADVRKEIDGPGGMTVVALWVLFIR
jgi:sporulation protein YlmC with PRC-barrel domain